MALIGLIRHAETVWNREKRIQGHLDAPLTPEAGPRALHWGRVLKKYEWKRLISSDLGRARETAVLINKVLQLPIYHDIRLREQDWGAWTGQEMRRIRSAFHQELARMETDGWAFCPPGGETRLSVWHRSRQVLEHAMKKWMEEDILVVTHAGVIRCLLFYLMGRDFLRDDPPLIQDAHLHLIRWDGEKFSVDSVNADPLNPEKPQTG